MPAPLLNPGPSVSSSLQPTTLYLTKMPTPPSDSKPQLHASPRSWVLLGVIWVCMLAFITPLPALAQAVGITPVPELAAAFSFWELIKQGGSLGIAAIAGWWALRKDKEAKQTTDARVEDAKAAAEKRVQEAREADARAMATALKSNEQMMALVTSMTNASVKMEAAVEGLTEAVKAFERK